MHFNAQHLIYFDMRNAVITICFLNCTLLCFSQNHDFVWLMGYGSQNISTDWGGTVIDFNASPPNISYIYNEMNFDVTAASMSDSEGNLQFYTNGIYVANMTHDTMVNGTNLNPCQIAEDFEEYGFPLCQGAFIIQHLLDSNKYYLIHTDYGDSYVQASLNGRHLYFSLVDMSEEAGLGKVMVKNQTIIADTLGTGKLTAVRHANGRDWWMVVHEMSSGKYHRVLISPDGINHVGSASTNYTIPIEGVGQSVFSPDGSTFVRVNAVSFELGQFLEIYKFDRCTGYLTEQVNIHYDDDALSAGVAISPNSRFLYVPSYNYLYIFDLQASDIEGSKVVVPYDGFIQVDYELPTKFFLAQLAPDGKIYINSPSGVHYLHVIHQPDLPYADCMVEQHGNTLPTYNAFSMPNFPNYRLGPLDGSPCDTLGLDNHPVAKFRYDQDTLDYLSVRFTDLSYYAPTNWVWDFGDGSSSNAMSPVHVFPSDGTFEVCLTASNQLSSDTFCRTLVIGTGISAANEAQPLDLVSVFPNPAQSATNFRLGGDYLPRHAMLTLYAATGQPVRTQRLQAGWSVVSLEGLAPGLYFYEVRDEQRLLGSGKLVRVE